MSDPPPVAHQSRESDALRTLEDTERQLAAIRDQLFEYQRLALLGRAAGMMAHEFNNLMTPVLARSEFALASDDPEMMRKALRVTLDQTQRAVRFTRTLLEMVRGRSPRVEPCRVADLVEATFTAAARPMDKDRIQVRLDIDPDLHVEADRLLFQQLLLNLILNARRAMKGGGELFIAACRTDDRTVRIRVADTGAGMSADHIRDVVNPFLAGDPNRIAVDVTGVGLGLNVVRTVAHRHRACVQVARRESGGCEYTIDWPASAPQRAGE